VHGVDRELLVNVSNAGGSELQSLNCLEINRPFDVFATKGDAILYLSDVVEITFHFLD
jgi:hypothetical protein